MNEHQERWFEAEHTHKWLVEKKKTKPPKPTLGQYNKVFHTNSASYPSLRNWHSWQDHGKLGQAVPR